MSSRKEEPGTPPVPPESLQFIRLYLYELVIKVWSDAPLLPYLWNHTSNQSVSISCTVSPSQILYSVSIDNLPCIRGDCVTAPSNVPSLTAALIVEPASNPAAIMFFSGSLPNTLRFWFACQILPLQIPGLNRT